MAEQRKKLRLGELLVQQGLITQDQLRIALTEQSVQKIPIGRLLVRLGFVTEAVIRDIMARTIGQESIDLNQVLVDAEALSLVPQEFARRHRLLPIAFDADQSQLMVAITEVFNLAALDQLRAMVGARVQIKTVLAGQAQLDEFIDQFYGFELSVDGILREIETGEVDYQSLQQEGGDEYTQPIVRLVGAMMLEQSDEWTRVAGRCGQARRVRLALRARIRLSARALPYRRGTGADSQSAQELLGGHCRSPQSHQRHEHR